MALDVFWIILLIVTNGFFVAAEFSIIKVRSSQVELQVKIGSRIGKIARHITNHVDGYLAAAQLGITFSSLGLGWVGVTMMADVATAVFGWFNVPLTLAIAQTLGFILAFSIITILHVVFGELMPRAIAVQRPVSTTMNVALPLRVFYIIFRPFVWLLNALANALLRLLKFNAIAGDAYHSSEELQYLLEQGRESGALNIAEHDLIKNVFDFNERIVKNIMVPRTKISAVEMGCPIDEFIDKVTEEGYSRIPVYDDNIDQIIGIIHTKDILPIVAKGKELVLKTIIRKPYFIPETKKINDLMAEFQQKRIQLAIVLDEFGGTAGIVTLEDIVEELVGEIQDEHDEEIPVVEQISETEYMVDASAYIHDVNAFLPLELPESSDYDTLAGLVSDLFDRIPDVGEHKEFNGYNLVIMKKTQQNIEFVKLELLRKEYDDYNN